MAERRQESRRGRPVAGRKKVVVTGATGRMGREVLEALKSAPDLVLVGAVARGFAGPGAERAIPLERELASKGVPAFPGLESCLRKVRPDVLIDFTSATVAPGYIRQALEAGIAVVSGTTGLAGGELEELGLLAAERRLGLVIIPNFSLGATVLAILARTAAPYFGAAEIIELHHDQKKDAPSGTALALARTVSAALRRPAGEKAPSGADPVSPSQPSRGLGVGGVPVHSVRLEGLVAHHELIFASAGETLTLRHDSASRASFMPGVLLAVRVAGTAGGLVTSLERVLDLARPDASGV